MILSPIKTNNLEACVHASTRLRTLEEFSKKYLIEVFMSPGGVTIKFGLNDYNPWLFEIQGSNFVEAVDNFSEVIKGMSAREMDWSKAS